jgi:hypothetical protein
MAKKSTPSVAPKTVAAKAQPAAAAAVVASTPVRNTPIPKAVAAPAKKVVTREQIAVRAFEISRGPNAGSQDDNWFRAERELQGL